jgi:AcrR family transcriptional regulator
MEKRTAASIRARVRAEMIDEIKETARRQLATEGANLSLRAIARELGMVSSALYRYFASRDELLTALIIDAYNAIGEAGERADAAIAERLDLTRRWLAVATAWREWALAHPAEYALIHGSPVPGYAAPADTIAPASRRFLVIAGIIRDGRKSGALAPAPAPAECPPVPAPLRAELDTIAAGLGFEAETSLTARALTAVTELFGALSFELFGQLNNTIDERRDWYSLQALMMADLIGLPPGNGPSGNRGKGNR